jgi:hypothetical protein
MTTKKILAIGAATIFTCTQIALHDQKNQVKVLLCRTFYSPSWWTYYDDDVIEHLDRLEAELGEEESKVKMPWEA